MHIPIVAVTTLAATVAFVATIRVVDGTRAVDTCRATFEEGVGTGIGTPMLGTVAATLGMVGGA